MSHGDNTLTILRPASRSQKKTLATSSSTTFSTTFTCDTVSLWADADFYYKVNEGGGASAPTATSTTDAWPARQPIFFSNMKGRQISVLGISAVGTAFLSEWES